MIESGYPKVQELIDPNWRPRPERLIASPEEIQGRSWGWWTGGLDCNKLAQIANGGLILDVGCGTDVDGTKTPVGYLPNAYGIDPMLNPKINDLSERAIRGYAEDLPFIEASFMLVIARRSVGWYTDVTVNTGWAIYEMLRVTAHGGLVNISIGSGALTNPNRNHERILEVLDGIYHNSDLGYRMGDINDNFKAQNPQISIRML